MRRPSEIFDREWEWDVLTRFAADPSPRMTFGIVSGRRRQGKSTLLRALCEVTSGIYVQAIEATRPEALAHLGRRLADALGSPLPLDIRTPEQAVRALVGVGDRLVVLDELPYLLRAMPELPSLLQEAIDSCKGRTRLLVCGSAISVMGDLLTGRAPLRGRAGLDLVVQPFDYRTAARFWGLESQPRLAFLVHAILGGTPAYRREFTRSDVPSSLEDFDDWVARAVLDPSSPLLREGRYLLAEEPDMKDSALYHSTLSALASGHTTRSAIAGALGRASSDLGHPLNVLQSVRLIERHQDLFRPRRPTYRIVEPILGFHHAIIRHAFGELERPGAAPRVWERLRPTFEAQILGPHLEEIAREWTAHVAPVTAIGGEPKEVGRGVVYDARDRSRHELDVVARGHRDGRETILLIGEVKWGRRLDQGDLRRLRKIRDLLIDRGLADADCRLGLFGSGPTSPELRDLAEAGEVLLVDLDRLYGDPERP